MTFTLFDACGAPMMAFCSEIRGASGLSDDVEHSNFKVNTSIMYAGATSVVNGLEKHVCSISSQIKMLPTQADPTHWLMLKFMPPELNLFGIKSASLCFGSTGRDERDGM